MRRTRKNIGLGDLAGIANMGERTTMEPMASRFDRALQLRQ